MGKTKISIVKYVNAMPLVWGILEGPWKDAFEPVFSTPAECAEQLASGVVDVGMIPSIEYQRIPGLRVVPGPAIGSRHQALSVILLSAGPLEAVRTVAADETSRSSWALARVLFDGLHGSRPEFHPMAPDPARMLAAHDAALVIGDAALRYQAGPPAPEAPRNFDLVEQWRGLTGLPFIFAFWAVRPGLRPDSLAAPLVESRDFGLERLEAIAARYAAQLGLDAGFVHRYLSVNLDYHMDADGLAALGEFYRRAALAGVIGPAREIEFS